MDYGIGLRPAANDDIGFIRQLLRNNDLPVSDIYDKIDCLFICECGGEHIGVGGLEEYDGVALLRSVAIKEEARGEGYGTALCKRLLAKASRSGHEQVYLLTETAPEFFTDLEFETTDRDTAPTELQATTEFRELCPSDAVCMKREIGAVSPIDGTIGDYDA